MKKIFKRILNSLEYRYRNYILANLEAFRFKLKNRSSSFHKTMEFRNPDHIVMRGYSAFGEGSKLICISNYSLSQIPQHLNPCIEIGENFHASRNFVIQCAGRVTIGNDVLVASNVFIIDFNHGLDASTKNYLDNPLEVEEVSIDDGAWIGNNVIVLPGVHIGKKSIVGAGSVVTRDIPDYSLAVGNPAKVIKRWDLDQKKWIPSN